MEEEKKRDQGSSGASVDTTDTAIEDKDEQQGANGTAMEKRQGSPEFGQESKKED